MQRLYRSCNRFPSMKILIWFCLGLYLVAPGFSTKCKNIPAITDFDFEEFIENQYRYYLVADIPEMHNYESAKETSTRIDDKWYSVVTLNFYNGSQNILQYVVDEVIGNTMRQKIMVNGEITNMEITTQVYAFKPDLYAQMYICNSNQDYGMDFRAAMVYGDSKVSYKIMKEMFINDAKMEFQGNLYRIGSDYFSDDDD